MGWPPVIFFLGLLVMQAQVLLFRELIVLMKGNELAIGLILSAWLGSTGLGSFWAGKEARRSPGTEIRRLLIGMAVSLPLSLVTLRTIPVLLGYGLGEPLPVWLSLSVSLMALGPFCFLSGALFPRLCGRISRGSTNSWSIRQVYVWEALGAAGGGALGIVLITRLCGLTLALGIAAGLAVLASGLAFGEKRPWKVRAPAGLLSLGLLVGILTAGDDLDRWSRGRQWRPYQLRLTRETPLGSLALVEKAGQYDFFMNGVYQFSHPDPRRAEEKTHLPLLLHPQPQRVLMIGGGVSGSLREVQKHPSISKVDFVELDRGWFETVGRVLPEVKDWLVDPSRVRIAWGDGRRFLEQSRETYDAILLDLPGPENLQLNRFYTLEFFRLAAGRLRPGGLLSFPQAGAVDLLGPGQSQALAILADTLQAVFPRVLIFAAEDLYLAGFNGGQETALTAPALLERWQGRSLALRYLTPLQLETTFSPGRLEYFSRLRQQSSTGEINRDLRPISTLHQTASTLAVRDPALARGFQAVAAIPYSLWLVGLVSIILGLSLSWKFSPRSGSRLPVAAAVGAAGLTGLALEVVILLLYQMTVGYLYLQIGLLLACFMAGLALGVLWVSRKPETAGPSRGPLILLQIALGVVPLLLWAFLQIGTGIPGRSPGALHLIFYMFMLLAGFLGGAHYLLGTRVHLKLSRSVGRTAGGLYGADLLGSALGSLLVSFLWVPVWGISRTLVFLSLLNWLLSLALWVWRMPGSEREPSGG